MKSIGNILLRILAVFAASGLSVIGAGAIAGVDTITAVTVAGLTEYEDPKTGFSVMTEPFLKAKGFCCKNDCRHCPYPA